MCGWKAGLDYNCISYLPITCLTWNLGGPEDKLSSNHIASIVMQKHGEGASQQRPATSSILGCSVSASLDTLFALLQRVFERFGQ